MFVLVEINKEFEQSCKEIKKQGFTPLPLLKISLSTKDKYKKDLKELLEQKKEFNESALQIMLEKIDNTTTGIVSQLKQEFDIVIGLGGLNKVNRFFLEQTQVDFLQDPQNVQFGNKIDFIHHLNSGLNHVLCQFAKEKNTGLLHSLNFISGKNKNVAKEIGRITQNLSFAHKYDLPLYLNFIVTSPLEVKSLIELKGIYSLCNLSTQQAKKANESLKQKVLLSKKKSSNTYICEGLTIEE